MPLFSGVPFFNVMPQQSMDPTRLGTGRALQAGLALSEQRRQFDVRNAAEALQAGLALSEQRRQFDVRNAVEAPLRATQALMSAAQLKLTLGKVADQNSFAAYLDALATNPNAPAPTMSTPEGAENLTKFQASMADRKFKASGIDQRTLFMNSMTALGSQSPEAYAEVMQMVQQDGLSPQAWRTLKSALAQTALPPRGSPEASPEGQRLALRRILQENVAQARLSGDPGSVQKAESELASFEQDVARSGQTIETISPEGTITRVITGKAGTAEQTPLQKTNMVRVERSLMDRQRMEGLMVDLVDNLADADVGLQGVVVETVLNRGLAQFGYPINKRNATNREKIRLTFEGIMKKISDDERFTREDRKAIADTLISPGVLESGQRARQALDDVLSEFARRDVFDVVALNKPLDQSTLINRYAVREAMRLGLISREQALSLLTRRTSALQPPSPSLDITNPAPAAILER